MKIVTGTTRTSKEGKLILLKVRFFKNSTKNQWVHKTNL